MPQVSSVPFAASDIVESGMGPGGCPWVITKSGEKWTYSDVTSSWSSSAGSTALGREHRVESVTSLSMNQIWDLLDQAATCTKRVLLWGPPGTGKSFLARTAGVNGHGVYPVPIHSDIPAAELRGHFIPTQEYDEDHKPIGHPILRWADGPVTAAWRGGGRLVLDEINTAGDDALSFLLAALDNHETARMVLGTTGEILTPHPDFSCWATMNAEPDELPPALLDRFPVTVKITDPNPAAIAALPADLQKLARELTVHPDASRRISLRKFIEFGTLREAIGEDKAAALLFPDQWPDLKPAIRLGRSADPR